MSYSAYVIDTNDRERLLQQFPPKYGHVIAHHVTEQFGILRPEQVHSVPVDVKVVGYTDDGGVEAVVVEVNGKSTRTDGKLYHITLSVAPGRKPVESNAVIKEKGWVLTQPLMLLAFYDVLD